VIDRLLQVALGLMGLHLPKAFSLLALALILLAWRCRAAPPLPPGWLRWSALGLLVFGSSYGLISLHYGLWTLAGRDLLDLIGMALLPAAGLWVGARAAAVLGWRQMAGLWLAYGLGALLFAWVVLLHGRVFSAGQLLEIWLRRRESSIAVPWGSDPLMNVRSIEQNAALAVAWLVPGLWLLAIGAQRRLAAVLVVSGLAALAAVLAFSGRLGLLVAALGLLPVLAASKRRWAWWPLGGCAALLLALQLRPGWGPRLLARLYDERFDRFAGFLMAAPQFPWGGDQIHFAYVDHQRQSSAAFDARSGELLHNVLFDIYARVGWWPALVLLLVLIPLLLKASLHLRVALRAPEPGELGGTLVAAGLLLCLTVQWLFQPLIYGDGLLFYLGFLLLGYLAAKRPSEAEARLCHSPLPRSAVPAAWL
jgi:hypothetical protein